MRTVALPRIKRNRPVGRFRCRRVRLAAEVGVAYLGVVEQLFTAAAHDDVAVLQHVAAISQLQRLVGVLLDKEHGHAIFAQLLDDVEDLLDDDRRQTQRRLV